MKKYESIMKRVRFIEEKYGIVYAKPGGKLFTTLKVIHTVAFIYTLGINLLFLAGMLLMYAGSDNFAQMQNSLITVTACTAVLIAGFVFLCTRLKMTGTVMSLISLPLMLLTFASSLKDDLGFMGYKASFYWRHFAPIAVMAVMLVWMLVIAARAKYKTDKQYKKIISNLYLMYNTAVTANGENAGITDEQWDEFLRNYDPRDIKKIPVSVVVDEEDTVDEIPVE